MWPMIVLRTPKGWTGPKEVDGKPTEGTWRSHQVPFSELAKNPEHLRLLGRMDARATSRRSCSTRTGRLRAEYRGARAERRAAHGREPARERRPAAAGSADAGFPRLRGRGDEAGHRARRGDAGHGNAACATSSGANTAKTFASSVRTRPRPTGFGAVFEVTDRVFTGDDPAHDEHLSPDGRVMEVLSEHMCQGWLEGYLLTGRHGFFSCYEAFIHIVDSMFNQHAKWLKTTREIPVAAADRLAQLSADLARLAAGSQRLQPPGSRLHRSRREQEGRRRPRLSAAGRQHAAVGDRPLPAQPQLRERDRRRQAAGAAVAGYGRGGQALHGRASASGSGRATTRTASPTS